MDAPGLGQAHVLGMSMGGIIQRIMAVEHPARLWQSPRWPFDAQVRAAQIGQCRDRAHSPDGARQIQAVEASKPVLDRIEEISTPFMVIHGNDDTALPLVHGRDIARRGPGRGWSRSRAWGTA
jgi:pimeloyl-ACP methyl ester carboxylesterase